MTCAGSEHDIDPKGRVSEPLLLFPTFGQLM
jgi:hypothetical protein